ncbi:ABC transporter permease [Anaerocolumna jejuensis]|uniref:ABC transporter permease n=1 Tax=Anaerocolumna jejuensis TaxID=259063 RepID=UPI003F7C3FC3
MKGKAAKKGGYAKSGPLLLIALPGILYLLINNYIPMFGVFLAFKNYDFAKGIFGSDWSGFDNFRFLFQTKDALIMTRNTLLYNLSFIVLGTVVSIFTAILLCELGKMARVKIFQSALLLPNLLSWVVIAYIGFAFLNSDTGFINNTLFKVLGKNEIAWYSEAKYWPFILTVVYLWKNIGYMSIIYMASISGIDKGIFEAAKLDGATKVKQIFYIIIPMLKSTVTILTLMAVGRIFFSDFGLFYQVPMNSGALYDTTQTIDTFVYRGLMKLNDVGMSSAAGLFQSTLGFILVLSANFIVKRLDKENALF